MRLCQGKLLVFRAFYLQTKSSLFNKLGLKDPVVGRDEGQLLDEGLAGEWGHHDLHSAGELVTEPLRVKFRVFSSLIKIAKTMCTLKSE